jgi:hypothetical protein
VTEGLGAPEEEEGTAAEGAGLGAGAGPGFEGALGETTAGRRMTSTLGAPFLGGF